MPRVVTVKPQGEPRNLRDVIQTTLNIRDPDAPMTVQEASLYMSQHQAVLALNNPAVTAMANADPKLAEAMSVLTNRLVEIEEEMKARQRAFESTRLYRSKRFQRHLATFRERHNLPPR